MRSPGGIWLPCNNLTWHWRRFRLTSMPFPTPFPDVRANYFPITITADGWFPVVDELEYSGRLDCL